ncbi:MULTISPECIES: sigma-54-dependent Fis family transcriptional regulator [unclassified Thiobacillus]|uniref:sigma-54 interaction domain-containing protein n=1 Tax=unclassified Thiobacillus TaxID=2646513 RepID=UPI00086F8ECB|nr:MULTISPECIES: sigma-54-dependent Fis family transcriptional regulator [unclassified Thiobacillus]MBN8780414.1 sigma 54-interacting transcriptional regulator [Thiobacillus sp.]ODV02997.1 MAG: Fis family transcriptional regulator [Thiobacillus sp. SCN 63-57]OJY55558.1 MAG: Fis family transcriptional regulator [Thiobacillus sp. 0-1251]
MSPANELISFLETHPDPQIVMGIDYRILAANAAYRRVYAGERNVVGQFCYAISHGYSRPCDECGESCPLAASRVSGEPRRVLHLHHTPRGEEHVDVELTPIIGTSGKIAYFVERMLTVREASSFPAESGMVGKSAAFNRMLELVRRVAPSDTAALLLGESGTGKELVAQAIHQQSRREHGPFVVVECSGLTETLFESELFGYEKGAFTGASQRKIGLVESASGGTLFLDEVGDIPLSLQVKLLRLLETGTFRRVGGVETLRADFRLIAATHRDLKTMVERGSFRRDLYYRLSVFPIHLPALRERRGDIALLAETLLARLAPGRAYTLSEAARMRLQAYDYPGNVRELRNIIERAMLMADGDTLLEEHLPPELKSDEAGMPGVDDIVPLETAELRYLQWALAHHGGDRKSLAAQLGISERTLYRKLAQ